MENIDVALSLASRGMYVFPCRGEGAGDDLKKPCPGIGWRGVSTVDPRTIRMFWHRFPTAVPGIDMGKSGLIAIDCDCRHSDGLAFIRTLGIDTEDVPGSVTPSGGRHLIYRNPAGFTNGRGGLPGKETADVDIRGRGGYIIGPGSRFVDGREYRPMGELEAIDDLPHAIAEYLSRTTVKVSGNGHDVTPVAFTVQPDSDARRWGLAALEGILGTIRAMPPGDRQDPIAAQAWKAGQLVWHGCLSEGEVIGAIEGIVRGWPDLKPGYLGERGTVRRQVREGMGQPRGPKTKPAVVINLDGTKHDPETGEVIGGDIFPVYEWTDPRDIPERDWVYGRINIRKFVSMTAAPGGVGKSSLLTSEVLAMVSGRDLLGIQPERRLRVVLWNLEDPKDELKRKIQATAKHFGLSRDDLGDRLMVNSGRERRLVVVTPKSGGRGYTVEPVVNAMIEEIKQKQIDVLIIDPFVSCNDVDENDNKGQDIVVKEWARVAEMGNCVVHLVDHTKKLAEGVIVTSGSNRGASSKIDACRVVRVINPMSDAEAASLGLESSKGYFNTRNDKSSMAPAARDQDWYRIENVNLGNGPRAILDGIEIEMGDEVGVVVKWERPELMEDVTGGDFEKVATVIRRGGWRASEQNRDDGTWVGFAVAEGLGLDMSKSADEAKIKACLRTWKRSGALEIYDDMVPGRRQSGKFVRVKEVARPGS